MNEKSKEKKLKKRLKIKDEILSTEIKRKNRRNIPVVVVFEVEGETQERCLLVFPPTKPRNLHCID
jgi:hypothetical protein